MRKPERPGAVGQKAAVRGLKQRAYAEERREAAEDAAREAARGLKERREAEEAARADDASSGTAGGGRSGFGLGI